MLKRAGRLGRHLADGEGYIRPAEFLDDGTRIPTAEFPPVFPTILAVLDTVGVGSPTGQRLAGALLGGLTVIAIGLLGNAVAGRAVGITAAWVAALTGGMADIGYFVFMDLGGYVNFMPGGLMTYVSASAILLSGWVWFQTRNGES